MKQNILAIKQSTKRIGVINQQVVLATTAEREAELSTVSADDSLFSVNCTTHSSLLSLQELTPLVNETNKKASLSKQLLQKYVNPHTYAHVMLCPLPASSIVNWIWIIGVFWLSLLSETQIKGADWLNERDQRC